MIVAANDVRYRHVVIVHDDRMVIGRRAIGAQNNEVVELRVGDDDAALHAVDDHGLAILRRLQANDRQNSGRRLLWIAIAPGAVIAYRAPLGARLRAYRFELGGRAIAVIGLALGEELARNLGVTVETRRLTDDVAIPVEAEP